MVRQACLKAWQASVAIVQDGHGLGVQFKQLMRHISLNKYLPAHVGDGRLSMKKFTHWHRSTRDSTQGVLWSIRASLHISHGLVKRSCAPIVWLNNAAIDASRPTLTTTDPNMCRK
eukprot:1149625-Pelagomonas_calceolata.AAC.4